MSTSRDDFGIVIRSALLQRGAKQKFSLFALILLSELPSETILSLLLFSLYHEVIEKALLGAEKL